MSAYDEFIGADRQAICDELDRLRAEVAELRSADAEWGSELELLHGRIRAERDAAEAEVKRMRPVIEAADGYASQRIGWRQFVTAVANYRAAVAALDAGEQQ